MRHGADPGLDPGCIAILYVVDPMPTPRRCKVAEAWRECDRPPMEIATDNRIKDQHGP